jgi:hypothetical protein
MPAVAEIVMHCWQHSEPLFARRAAGDLVRRLGAGLPSGAAGVPDLGGFLMKEPSAAPDLHGSGRYPACLNQFVLGSRKNCACMSAKSRLRPPGWTARPRNSGGRLAMVLGK